MKVKPTTTKTVQDAYRIVLNDMLNSGCDLLVGKYDGKNGKPDFMYGIQTVMEWIAYKVSETDGNYFSDLFGRNLIESKKVLTNKSKGVIINTSNEREVKNEKH